MAKRKPSTSVVRNPYQFKAAGDSAELLIFGDIGEDWWAEESNDAKTVVEKIQNLGLAAKTLTVRINSYGGVVADGLAIYNALRRFPGETTVSVEGVAVSIASLITMAGDTVIMPVNSMLMIHAPWGVAVGNAPDLREMADTLDKFAEGMAHAYATKTGRGYEEMLSLLQDGNDHWFTAAEAVEEGFADFMSEELEIAASFDLGRFSTRAAPAAKHQEVKPMTTEKLESSVAPLAEGQNPNPPGTKDINIADIESQAQARERSRVRARNNQIMNLFDKHLHREGVGTLLNQVLADPEVDPSMAGQRLLDHLATNVGPIGSPSGSTDVQLIEDSLDKRKLAVSDALMVRAAVANPEIRARVDGSNPYRGFRLLDIAKESVERAGVNIKGMLPKEIVAAAFTQSTSDFPVLLETTMNKTLLSAYRLAPDTWSRFCTIGSVSDFRDHNRYRTGSLSNLEVLNELGEFENKAIPDGEKVSVNVHTRGNLINLSRQMVINDDLGAFVGLAAQLGRAARRTIEATVYDLINENGGLGPTQADGQPLLHSNRSNVDATGGVNSVIRWDAMRIIMANQMDVSGLDYLDLRPSIWLGPVGLGGAARGVNEAEYDDEATKNQRRPNVSRGLVRDIVDTPRLTGTRYYLLSDPSEAPVIEVVFLDGVQEPFLDQETGFDVDGTRYKVRLDFGVHAVDYRGIVTNAGT